MRRVLPIFSLLLAVLWLPSTQHCNLMAAGLIAGQCADGCATGSAQSGDGCRLLEGGLFKVAADVVKAPAPDLLACNCFLCVELIGLVEPIEVTLIPEASAERSLDWVKTWNFVRRAAPPSRAPSVRCA